MDIKSNEKKKDDITEVKVVEYYKDKKIAEFFRALIDNKINRMLEELNHYYEIGDWRKCIILYLQYLKKKIK